MDKLQLYISKSVRGFKMIREINPDPNVKAHIRDLRKALEIIDYDPHEKCLFYLVSYIEEGVLFTILRTIPDKPLDHLAATIFIPAGLDITPDQLGSVVRRTTAILSNPSVSAEDLAELMAIFSKQYPSDPQAQLPEVSQGLKYAWRYYGQGASRNFDGLLDEVYNPEYAQYAGVFFIDRGIGISARGAELGAAPASAPEPVASPAPKPEAAPAPAPASKQAPAPKSESAQKAASAKAATPAVYRFDLPIYTNGGTDTIQFEIASEHPLEDSPVEGYEMTDELSAEEMNYLEYSGGDSSRFSLRLLVLTATAALIIGFLAGWAIFHKSAPKIVAGATTEIVEELEEPAVETELQASVSVAASQEPAAEPEQAAATATPAPATPQAPGSAAPMASGDITSESIAYLDNNKKWTRSEMEALPGLGGLYDDMNTFNRSRLTGYWKTRLEKSKTYGRVAHHVAEGARKNIFKPQGTYNTPGDEVINIQTYLNRVDPAKPAK